MNRTGLRILSGFILALALLMIGFCLYIIPYAFFGSSYEMPEFLLKFVGYLERVHAINSSQAFLLILIGLILIAFILFRVIAYIEFTLQKRLIEEAQHPIVPAYAAMADEEAPALEEAQLIKSNLWIKYLAVILLVLLIVAILEYLITQVRFEGIF